jgi:short-subunit dehydrogenase
MQDLRGQVAIITGASSGIGAATAQALAQAGCDVALAARRQDRLDKLAAAIERQYPVRALALATDVTDRTQVERLMARVEEELGGVDILINNAGLGLYGSVSEGSEADLRYVFDVNFFAAAAMIQAVTPAMQRRGGGTIVNVSSIMSKFTMPQMGMSGAAGGYSASKAALDQISAAARMELAADNIHVITLLPGRTASEFDRHFRVEGGEAADQGPARSGYVPPTPAEQVGRRIVTAIRRREREVYVSWRDRLIVMLITGMPGPYEWAMKRLYKRRVGDANARLARSQSAGMDDAPPARDPRANNWIGAALLATVGVALIAALIPRKYAE